MGRPGKDQPQPSGGGGDSIAAESGRAVTTEPEGFDLAKFEVTDQSMAVSIEKKVTTIPVRKPDKQKFFTRNLTYQPVMVNVLELKEEGDYYLVPSAMMAVLAGETKLVKLYVCHYQNGTMFLCPVPQPDSDGKWNNWHRSLAEVMVEAEKGWVRAISNKSLNGYDMRVPNTSLVEPRVKTSAEYPIQDVLKLAFKDRIIESEDHPVVKALFGEA